MTHLVHLAESVIDVDSAPQICEKDPLQLPIRWPAGKGLGMPSPYIDVIVLSCLLGKAMRADRSYPAYPSVSRRAQVAGTGAPHPPLSPHASSRLGSSTVLLPQWGRPWLAMTRIPSSEIWWVGYNKALFG